MRQENEHRTVDTAIIGISGAMLPALGVVLSLNAPLVPFVRYALASAVATAALTLILTLWNTLRYPKRHRLAEEAIKDITKKMSSEIMGFSETVVAPLTMKQFEDSHEQVTLAGKEYFRVTSREGAKDEIKNSFIDVLEKQKPQIMNIVTVYSHEIGEANRKFFRAPLTESFAWPKYVFDMVAFRARYLVFFVCVLFLTVGLVGWLATVQQDSRAKAQTAPSNVQQKSP